MMVDQSINQLYSLPDPSNSAALDAALLRETLIKIDAGMTAALSSASATQPGRIRLGQLADIEAGKKDVVPVSGDIKDYVADRIASLIETTEGALDALAKLREAIGNDEDFAGTILSRLEQKADIAAVKNNLVPVGAEMYFSGLIPPPSWLIEDGSLILRRDIPALTQHALNSGMIVTEEEWYSRQIDNISTFDRRASFSYGPGGVDGEYLRLPDTRGLFVRTLDLGSGVDFGRLLGTLQQSANRLHFHLGRTLAAGKHKHSVWTAAAGSHGHVYLHTAWGDIIHTVQGGPSRVQTGTFNWNEQYGTEWAGNHLHPTDMAEAPDHDHELKIDEDGEREARPINVSRLMIIKY